MSGEKFRWRRNDDFKLEAGLYSFLLGTILLINFKRDEMVRCFSQRFFVQRFYNVLNR